MTGRFAMTGARQLLQPNCPVIQDLLRSAIQNLIAAGVPENVAISISGHKTRAAFDRYHIVGTAEVSNAMKQVEKSFQNGESLVRGGHQPRAK